MLPIHPSPHLPASSLTFPQTPSPSCVHYFGQRCNHIPRHSRDLSKFPLTFMSPPSLHIQLFARAHCLSLNCLTIPTCLILSPIIAISTILLNLSSLLQFLFSLFHPQQFATPIACQVFFLTHRFECTTSLLKVESVACRIKHKIFCMGPVLQFPSYPQPISYFSHIRQLVISSAHGEGSLLHAFVYAIPCSWHSFPGSTSKVSFWYVLSDLSMQLVLPVL